jgi:mono/diheme cytochrome c family protein
LSTRNAARLAGLAFLFVALSGFTLPGCPWFKMMKYQQSRDGFSFDTDNYDAPGPKLPTMRAPAPGSVPIDGGDLPVTLLDVDAKLSNPTPINAVSIARGQVTFGNMCSPCHGLAGRGDGPVGKLFPFVLPLAGSKAQHAMTLSDATIYAIIRQGRGLMPSYGSRVNPAERWDVINYVRSLQGLKEHVLKSAAATATPATPGAAPAVAPAASAPAAPAVPTPAAKPAT